MPMQPAYKNLQKNYLGEIRIFPIEKTETESKQSGFTFKLLTLVYTWLTPRER